MEGSGMIREQILDALRNEEETLADAKDDTSALQAEDVADLRKYITHLKKMLADFDQNQTHRTSH